MVWHVPDDQGLGSGSGDDLCSHGRMWDGAWLLRSPASPHVGAVLVPAVPFCFTEGEDNLQQFQMASHALMKCSLFAPVRREPLCRYRFSLSSLRSLLKNQDSEYRRRWA